MKNNQPINDKQKNFDDSARIVSSTDLKGKIIYANEDFINISGFSKDEIIGENHNLIRHPDMPPAAFANLWENVKQGKSWMGIVKNRCANGDYYWVDAFVAPVFEGNSITGYQSVRLKPEKNHVNNAEKLYKQLSTATPLWQYLLKPFKTALMGKIITANVLSITLGVLVAASLGSSFSVENIAALSTMLISTFILGKWLAQPWQLAAKKSESICHNPLVQAVYCGRQDELGQLQSVIQMQKAQLETVVWRLNDATSELQNAAEQAAQSTRQTEVDMGKQQLEVQQVATAMNEMTSTVQEVARNTSFTAESTKKADIEVRLGKDIVDKTINSIQDMASKVEDSVVVIKKLANDSEQINGVVDVIRNVAEQTNLLALNAAIEAARAGSQGRGFAVVADEVRTLASRTQSSTDEIQQMVKNLLATTEDAVSTMEQSHKVAQGSVGQAAEAGESLNSILQAVDNISQMSAQIATAAEEQSAVSDEINQNIINISLSAENTVEMTSQSSRANQLLINEIARIQTMVRQFGIGR